LELARGFLFFGQFILELNQVYLPYRQAKVELAEGFLKIAKHFMELAQNKVEFPQAKRKLAASSKKPRSR